MSVESATLIGGEVSPVRIGSLFSGYGGLDMAVSSVLGGQVAWHVEYDKAPSRILEHHYPDVPNYGDVTQVDFTTIERVDVLTGGYPCQPFSHAGLRKGTDDDRHLWPHVLRAIREMGPRLVLLENVRGHLTLGFDVVLADLADLGWSARWGIVRASDAGAPHQRARLFILAYPDNGRRREHHQGQRGVSVADQIGARLANADSTGLERSSSRSGQAPSRGRRHSESRTSSPTSHPDVAGSQARGDARHDSQRIRQQSVGLASPTADASGQRHGRGQDAGMVGRLGAPSDVIGREASATRQVTSHRGHEDAADATHNGRHRRASQPDPIRSSDLGRDVGQDATPFRDGNGVAWGDYGPAIARWEHVIGRPAPAPTELGRTGNPRLAPRFVEWMMGLPDGHVTDPAIGISRNDQLKALGNGVVPQQAALALRHLLAA